MWVIVAAALVGACGGEEITGPSTGSLTVTVSGLAGGQDAAITVTGPGAFTKTLTRTETVPDLAPGQYAVSAAPVSDVAATYAPTTALQQITVAAGATPTSVSVTYALASGSMAITVTGLPVGTPGDITVSGSGGYTTAVTEDVMLPHLEPGTYTVAAAIVVSGNNTYEPAVASQDVAVTASLTARAVGVDYALSSGSLDVTISGLPGGTDADVTVTAPGYSAALTASSTLTNIAAGPYTIDARNVSDGVITYVPNPASQSVQVDPGATASAAVSYAAAGPATLNLSIDGVHVTQSVQTYDGAVPLVAGRDGFLRVFVQANQPNSETPDVRVRLYDNGVLTNTFTIPAPEASVPTAVDEGDLTASWNLDLPASLIQPNLEILADVDPSDAVIEQDEADNAFPASGTPAVMDVRTINTFMVRFIPVEQSINGLTGNVTGANTDQFLAKTEKIFPLVAYDADVRAPYTYSDTIPIERDNATGTWSRVLSEINALRTADGSSRYYYGVVRVDYSSGIAGIGYVPGKAAVGWDHLPSGSEIAAHELGHNWGRGHAPCGGAPNPEASYPYPGGVIGVYGYDRSAGALKDPSTPDVMGYCPNDWISDYTYSNVLAHISASFGGAQPAQTSARVLLVWGRVRNGRIELEPAFEIPGRPVLPSRPGRYAIDGTDESGGLVFTLSFDPVSVPDGAAGEGHFAFAVPLDHGQRLPARIAVTGPPPAGMPAVRATAPVPAAQAPVLQQPAVEARGPDRVLVRWDHRRTPMVLVRDPASGEILSFARGGAATIRTSARELELTASDGVRSATRRTPVPGR